MKKTAACLLVLLALAFLIFPLTNLAKAQNGPTVTLTPSQVTVSQVNQIFAISITISNVQNLFSWEADVYWDPTVLNLTSTPAEGNFLSDSGAYNTEFIPISINTVHYPPPSNIPNDAGEDISGIILSQGGVNGTGTLATLQFQVVAESASTTIYLYIVGLSAYSLASNGAGVDITPTSNSATATVSFASTGAPSANAGPDQTVSEGSTVTFDGSKSISTGSNPTYKWTFNDTTPQTLTGVTQTYTFNTPGIYLVTLTLTDSYGTSTSTVTITVQSNSPPVAEITIEGLTQGQNAATGQPITFDGSGSYEANNGTIAKYIWAASSGAADDLVDTTQIGSDVTITHTFSDPGEYNITLTVFDATNLTATNSTTLTVVKGTSTSPSPTETSTPNTGSSPSPATSSSNTSSPTPVPDTTIQSSGVPPDILAILIIVTIAVLAGSTFWLRKRT